MRAHRRGTERDTGHGAPTTDTARRTGAAGPSLLALQRSAGNAAVTRLVEQTRQDGPERGPHTVVQLSPETSRPPSRASQESQESQASQQTAGSQGSGTSGTSAHSQMTPADAGQIKFTQDKVELLNRIDRIKPLAAQPGFCSGVTALAGQHRAGPVCRRTSPKSVPNRDSISPRSGASSGRPAPRSTPCTEDRRTAPAGTARCSGAAVGSGARRVAAPGSRTSCRSRRSCVGIPHLP